MNKFFFFKNHFVFKNEKVVCTEHGIYTKYRANIVINIFFFLPTTAAVDGYSCQDFEMD